MKIGLLENGVDSLQRGFQSFLDYEKATVDKPATLEDYLNLKQAVLSTHHGIEILMKYVLSQNSEFLIVSKFDTAYMKAYEEKKKQNKTNVFETSHAENVHTITYEEALERIRYFTNIRIPKGFEQRLKKLNRIRNSLTHAEIDIQDEEITELFLKLLNEIDYVFFKAIGSEYKTMTGYSSLLQNYDEYMKYLTDKNMPLKKRVVEVFKNAIEKSKIPFGEEEIIYIPDIQNAKQIISEITKADFRLGMDMYNGFCSGNVKIQICDEEHMALFACDNPGQYVFKFKSMIIRFPRVTSHGSPVIIFESDVDDSCDEAYKDVIRDDFHGGRCLEGICFDEETPPRTTYDYQEIVKFYNRCDYDDEFVIPSHYFVEHFLSHNIFACINVQGLGYGDFGSLLAKTEGWDGHQLAVCLRKEK